MNVMVIGECCRDIFMYGTCERMCPEAPVPVFKPCNKVENYGMAGNVEQNLQHLDIKTFPVFNTDRPVKTRYVDKVSDQMLLRIDEYDEVIQDPLLLSRVSKMYMKVKPDAIIVSDYDKGYLNELTLQEIGAYPCPTFLDSKKVLSASMCSWFSYVKINMKEYKNCLHSGDDLMLLDNVIITDGGNGCIFHKETYSVTQAEVRDVSGAGDTFLSALVAMYCTNQDIKKAIEFANVCASYAVTKKGVTSEFPEEIKALK